MRAVLIILLLGFWQLTFGVTRLCSNKVELNKAIQTVEPGDSIVMANGQWNDLSINFFTNGTPEKPIVLCSEDFGKVFIEGESYLMLYGSYLVVDGLIFRNGHSPKSAVISFKKSSTQVANNCRVTNCAIDQFTNTDRYERNYWVAFFGKNNRLDHCYLGGKLNYGSTVTVWLGNEACGVNKHRIDHNYFGHRPRLGSNGGETIRIGSSKNSMISSQTIIESNYFEQCNGETEIISIKSCDNIVRRNTFFECEGSLVLRHGNNNKVYKNVFIGNELPYTGGIRVIGEDHKIYNNYFQDLRGKEFRSPLVLMNGIPNSPLNRYFQVKNVVIAHNTWVNCEEPWLFGMGIKNESNTIPPIQTYLLNNLVYSNLETNKIVSLDDISGIQFSGNVLSNSFEEIHISGITQNDLLRLNEDKKLSIDDPDFDFPNNNNATELLREFKICDSIVYRDYISDINQFNSIPNRNNSGPSGYEPVTINRYQPYEVFVKPGDGTLDSAIEEAKPGALLSLEAGTYIINKRLKINHPIIIKGIDHNSKPILKQHGTENTKVFFEINYGGELQLENLIFDGESSSSHPSKYAITSAKRKMAKPYLLSVVNCSFHSFTAVDSGGAVFRAYKASFADSIIFKNCEMFQVFRGLDLDDEVDDKGRYNAEYVSLSNVLFKDIDDYSVSFYRGGKDESTFGPHLSINHCVFDNVNNKEGESVLKLVGVQRTKISNSIFYNSPNVKYVVELYGKYNSISHCNIYESGQIGIENNAIVGPGMLYYNPLFESEGYNLEAYSLLIGKAEGGRNIGLLNNYLISEEKRDE